MGAETGRVTGRVNRSADRSQAKTGRSVRVLRPDRPTGSSDQTVLLRGDMR
jgi:hypothetical protein